MSLGVCPLCDGPHDTFRHCPPKKLAPVQECRTCKHWDAHAVSRQPTRFSDEWEEECPKLKVRLIVYDGPIDSIDTPATFGCNMWEEFK